mmetsp:Transcript_21861/g.62455  ORF Transcript_21861/g.62455 Transcript_21861/m.62455 type:complete len:278 (-) Transcript_21861:77-910(-)
MAEASAVHADFSHTGQSDIRLDLWAKATVMGIVIAIPAAVIGLTAKVNPIDSSDLDDWDKEVGLQVFMPALIWYIIANKVTGTVAYHLGKDMLQESNAEIKEAVRSNMTTTGVVLALVLSIVIGMLQNDLHFETENLRVALWYRILLVLSIESCLKGILMSCFFLVYMEPLSPTAAKAFSIDNVNYLGEPFTGVVLSLAYFLCAMALWIFGVDGFFMGLAVVCVITYTMIRSIVVWMYMNCWQNPEIPPETRKKRDDFFRGLYQVVAKKRPGQEQQQ